MRQTISLVYAWFVMIYFNDRDMKHIFLLVMIIFSTTNINAQMSGGQIKRGVSTEKHLKNHNNKKKPNKGYAEKLDEMYNSMTMETLEKKANKDDVMAQFYLGYKYAQKEQYTIAVTWFRNAASRGLVRAQLWLAYCYYQGKGCDKDWTLARQWLYSAAQHGSEDAKEYLNTWFK